MADYDSGLYDGEISEYQWTPNSYDVFPYQNSLSFSDFDFHDEPKFIDHYHTNYSNAYDSYYATRPEMNHYTYNYSQPKLIGYEPIPYDTGYVSYQTQYLLSYSTKETEFNEPEFEEYDPTPYGGGYDPTVTYGKPLPPSDEICYPRSTPEKFSGVSIPPATEKNGAGSNISENIGVSEVGKKSNGESGDLLNVENGSDLLDPINSNQGEEREGYAYSDYGYGYGYGYPYEYNSDVVDICEGLFGHWPCLARKKQQQQQQRNNGNQEISDEGRKKQPWEEAADYLFGYGKEKYGGSYGGDSSYG